MDLDCAATQTAWRLRIGPLHPRPAMQLGCLVHAVDEAAFHVRALLLGAAAHQVTHEHGDQVLSAGPGATRLQRSGFAGPPSATA